MSSVLYVQQTIGFFGLGSVDPLVVAAILRDQITAANNQVQFVIAAGAPWETETSLVVSAFAMKEGISVEIVTEAKDYPMEASQGVVSVTKVTNAPAAIVRRLSKAERPLLLVFWDTSDATWDGVQSTLDAGIVVRDICDVGTRLGSLPTKPNKELKMPEIYTQEELDAMDTEEITATAEAWEIDHDSYQDWEPVVAEILRRQDEALALAAEEDGEVDAGVADEETTTALAVTGDGTVITAIKVFTEEELNDTPLEVLKQICVLNGVVIPGSRPRSATLIPLILRKQEEQLLAAETVAAVDGDVAEIIGTAVSELGEAFSSQLNANHAVVVTLLEGIGEELGRLADATEKLAANTPAISPVRPAKTTSPLRDAAKRASVSVRPPK